MKSLMFSDEQILNKQFRVDIIKEIEGQENKQRKAFQYQTWKIWKDQVREFVLTRLKNQGFKESTIAIMNERATNINFFKKVISKKARSYAKGADRSVENSQEQTKSLEQMAKLLELNKSMKRADRYRKAAKQCLLYVYPEYEENEQGQKLAQIKTKVFFPHLYDVIPDANDKEKMRCLILSPYSNPKTSDASNAAVLTGDGRQYGYFSAPYWSADGIGQMIANHPDDKQVNGQPKEYVFWTKKYHLTCDEKGEIIAAKSPDDNKNPIGVMPAVNMPEDQDGEFWCIGGDDLREGTILLNLKLTDMESILHMQGWGQLVVKGQDIKNKTFQIGPQVALILETDPGAETQTEAQILQHDPHTDDHLKSAESLVALLLTTNNLSVKSIATDLSVSSVASAIAKMVDEADNLDDVSEDQEFYADREKEIFEIAKKWVDVFAPTRTLDPKYVDAGNYDTENISIKLHNQEQVVTEQERLTNLKLRKELGIDTLVDLIKKDNPSLNEEQAKQKAQEILAEKIANQVNTIGKQIEGQDAETQSDNEDDQTDDSEDETDEEPFDVRV